MSGRRLLHILHLVPYRISYVSLEYVYLEQVNVEYHMKSHMLME